MTQNLVNAILPLLGVLFGASLHYYFSRSAESRKQLRLLRFQAYSDYLRVVAKLAHVNTLDKAKRSELFSEAADAKARISIYGSSTVLSKLAAFEQEGAVISSEKSIQVFLELCQAMRGENEETKNVALSDLHLVLFGPSR